MRLTNAVDEDVDMCVCETLSSTMQLELNCNDKNTRKTPPLLRGGGGSCAILASRIKGEAIFLGNNLARWR
jgi:hypothetical protein